MYLVPKWQFLSSFRHVPICTSGSESCCPAWGAAFCLEKPSEAWQSGFPKLSMYNTGDAGGRWRVVSSILLFVSIYVNYGCVLGSVGTDSEGRDDHATLQQVQVGQVGPNCATGAQINWQVTDELLGRVYILFIFMCLTVDIGSS